MPRIPGLSKLFVGLLLSCPLLSCASVLDIEDTEIGKTPVKVTGDWSCLGKPRDTTPKAEKIKITFNTYYATDAAKTKPVSGVKFRVCSSRQDILCANEIGRDADNNPVIKEGQILNDSNQIAIEVETGTTGFDGYIAISDVNGTIDASVDPPRFVPSKGGSISFLYFFSPPLLEDFEVKEFLVLDNEVLSAFVISTDSNSPVDPTRAHFSAHVEDCSFNFVSDVSLSSSGLDGLTTPWYFTQGAPNKTAKGTDSASGALGGFFNHPTSTSDISATLADGRLAARVPSVLMRPGVLSTMTILPNQ